MKNLLIILDAAKIGERLKEGKNLHINYSSLYKNFINLDNVAPFLFTFEQSSSFSTWYLKNGWGNAWGLLLRSSAPFDLIEKHLTKFVVVRTEQGNEVFFRFHDPRVLKKTLPNNSKQQTLEFFGPVDSFIVEGETKEEAIVFKQKNGELITEKILASQVFGELAEGKIPETKISEESTEGKRKPRKFIF